MNRRWEFDALRGLMLVLMTVTHLPTRWSDPLGQPFGFVSAAEGFVMLSGFMAGMVYTGRAKKAGPEEMRSAFLQRALKIYLCQAALLAFLLTIVALVAWLIDQPAILNLIGFFLEHPLTAVVGGLLLIYSPPLLDILPMYILFMLVSPVLLLHGMRHGWGAVLAVSVGLWLGAQFDLGERLYAGVVALTGLPVPVQQTGSFDILAWQFMWVLGLWLGAGQVLDAQAPPLRFPRWMLRTAIAIAATGFVWRHAVGQVPFPGHEGLNLMFDKWQLGPLRVIDFFALVVLLMHYAEPLKRWIPRQRWLETLGSASLPVFVTHLMLALTALALAGEAHPDRALWIDGLILVGSFAVLWAVAWTSGEIDRRTARLKQRLSERRKRLAERGQRPAPAVRPSA